MKWLELTDLLQGTAVFVRADTIAAVQPINPRDYFGESIYREAEDDKALPAIIAAGQRTKVLLVNSHQDVEVRESPMEVMKMIRVLLGRDMEMVDSSLERVQP